MPDFSAYKAAVGDRNFIMKHNRLCAALAAVVFTTGSGSLVPVDFERNRITDLGPGYIEKYNGLVDDCARYIADSFEDFRIDFPAVNYVAVQNGFCDALSAINVSIYPKPGTIIQELALRFWDPTATMDPRITFTRASNASRWNHYGVLEVVSSGVARAHQYADHDPASYTTSTDSRTIGSGSVTFTVGFQFTVGDVVRATYDDSNYMVGRVTSAGASSVTIRVDRAVGSGSYSSWHVIRVLGFMIEGQRTNSIRNNTMVGVSAPSNLPADWNAQGNLSGLVRTFIGTGVYNGIEYVDLRWQGTANATAGAGVYCESNNIIAAANGQVWSESCFLAVVAGSTAGLTSLRLNTVARDSLGAGVQTFGGTNILGDVGAALTHFKNENLSLTNASTQFLVSGPLFLFANGANIDITLRIGLPQLERGAFATSPIKTSGSAATRLADGASMTGTNFSSWYRQDEGAFVASTVCPALLAGDLRRVFETHAGSSAERHTLFLAGTSLVPDYYVAVGNVGQSDLRPAVPLVAGSTYGIAIAYSENNFGASANGSIAMQDSSGAVPTTNQLLFGNGTGGGTLYGHVRSLDYYRQRVSNADLQMLSGAA